MRMLAGVLLLVAGAAVVAFVVQLWEGGSEQRIVVLWVSWCTGVIYMYCLLPSREEQPERLVLTVAVATLVGCLVGLLCLGTMHVLAPVAPMAVLSFQVREALLIGSLGGYTAGLGPALAGMGPGALLRAQYVGVALRQAAIVGIITGVVASAEMWMWEIL